MTDTVTARLTRDLPPAQRAVVFQTSTGKSVAEIADALGIAVQTVKQQRWNASRRLGKEAYRKAIFRNG